MLPVMTPRDRIRIELPSADELRKKITSPTELRESKWSTRFEAAGRTARSVRQSGLMYLVP